MIGRFVGGKGQFYPIDHLPEAGVPDKKCDPADCPASLDSHSIAPAKDLRGLIERSQFDLGFIAIGPVRYCFF